MSEAEEFAPGDRVELMDASGLHGVKDGDVGVVVESAAGFVKVRFGLDERLESAYFFKTRFRKFTGFDSALQSVSRDMAAEMFVPPNPKEAIGILKAPITCIPMPVMFEVGLAMLEGGLKYGRHNYRSVAVRASVYVDAAFRHLAAFWEGEDNDPDSAAQISHITKAIAGLTVLRDSMLRGNWDDDRPPKTADGWLERFNGEVAKLVKQYPQADQVVR